MIAAIIIAAVALLVGYLGYRIRVRGDVHLIAGYDPARTRDPVGLGNWVGGWVMAIAAGTFALGVVQLALPWATYLSALVFAVGLVLALSAMARGRRRYLK